ncbi:MAG: aminotransferase class I/II-fold pyridoxal phosphate-dependent enzyme [Clostridiales bacterium]|nr:aminotransferase class I/II-fold pyridoxal phosphate-dependent enzyme [Clostridiales bacterium]
MVFIPENFLSNAVKAFPSSGIGKFFDIKTIKPEAISFGLGEPDFVTPQVLREAAVRSLAEGKTSYTSSAGVPELRKAIAGYLEESFGVSYDHRDEIIVTVGGSEAIDIALRALINPQDEIIIPEPCFVSYKPCAALAGAKVVTVPTGMESGFKVTAEELEKYLTPRTKALFINSPSNPTGVAMTKEELLPIADFVKKHNLLVISDEIYAELTYDAKHCSIASFPGMKERTVIISGFSKAFAMTGWRIGYICAHPAIIKAILKIHQYVVMCAPMIGQYAALEGLKSGGVEVARMTEEYKRRRAFVVSRFRAMGLPICEPGGAFYAFPCIKETGLSSEEFCERLLDEQCVAVVPGNAFGASGEGFIRCSYATSMEMLKAGLERMEIFLRGLKRA